jgi:hypothetical protein|tara:strand:- start:392 stop:514 length:123 start_codon:yes stop_codon:yes gene_type:complete
MLLLHLGKHLRQRRILLCTLLVVDLVAPSLHRSSYLARAK